MTIPPKTTEAPITCHVLRASCSHNHAVMKAKMISLVATIPAAVAERRFRALRERRKGANEPSVTFHTMRSQTGTEIPSRLPPREVAVVKVSEVNVHHRENGAQNRVATLMVQNDSASGEMVFSCRSPTRK